MRKKIMVIITVALIICVLGTVAILNNEPNRCPLCQFNKSHAPCIVNIKTGGGHGASPVSAALHVGG